MSELSSAPDYPRFLTESSRRSSAPSSLHLDPDSEGPTMVSPKMEQGGKAVSTPLYDRNLDPEEAATPASLPIPTALPVVPIRTARASQGESGSAEVSGHNESVEPLKAELAEAEPPRADNTGTGRKPPEPGGLGSGESAGEPPEPNFGKDSGEPNAVAQHQDFDRPDPPDQPEVGKVIESIPSGNEAIRLGADLHEWHDRIGELIAQDAKIIAFRGAGTVNGIDPQAAEAATSMLHDYVARITADGIPVALMYDGDGDDRAKPDIGSIFGGLVDSLGDDPNVTAIAAQREGWYSPRTLSGSIESATGRPFETYVFPDDVPGAHAALTQSDALVAYPGYEQVFVGPAGPIAFSQLGDLSQKAVHYAPEAGEVRVTVLATPNNPAVDQELKDKLSGASDDQARAKIAAKLTQRAKQPYGALFTPTGEFAVRPDQFPGVNLSVTQVMPVLDSPPKRER